MKNLLILLSLACLNSIAMSQTTLQEGRDYKLLHDDAHDENYLQGEVTETIIESYPDFSWCEEGKTAYQTDSASMEVVKKHLNKYEIFVFFGTWCGDSQYLMPHFFKIIEEAGYPLEKLRIFAVDRAKQAMNVEKEMFEIERVPTFIFYQKNNEKGRIIESVETTLEDAMAKFLEIEEDFKTQN